MDNLFSALQGMRSQGGQPSAPLHWLAEASASISNAKSGVYRDGTSLFERAFGLTPGIHTQQNADRMYGSTYPLVEDGQAVQSQQTPSFGQSSFGGFMNRVFEEMQRKTTANRPSQQAIADWTDAVSHHKLSSNDQKHIIKNNAVDQFMQMSRDIRASEQAEEQAMLASQPPQSGPKPTLVTGNQGSGSGTLGSFSLLGS